MSCVEASSKMQTSKWHTATARFRGHVKTSIFSYTLIFCAVRLTICSEMRSVMRQLEPKFVLIAEPMTICGESSWKFRITVREFRSLCCLISSGLSFALPKGERAAAEERVWVWRSRAKRYGYPMARSRLRTERTAAYRSPLRYD